MGDSMRRTTRTSLLVLVGLLLVALPSSAQTWGQQYPLLEAYAGYQLEVLEFGQTLDAFEAVSILGTTIRSQAAAVGGDPRRQEVFDRLVHELTGFCAMVDVVLIPMSNENLSAVAQAALRGELVRQVDSLFVRDRGGMPGVVVDFFTYYEAGAHLSPGGVPPRVRPTLDLTNGFGGGAPPLVALGVTPPPVSAPATAPANTGAPVSSTSFGPLAQTGSGAWGLYDKPACTWLVQLMIDEGLEDRAGAYGSASRGRYVIPAAQEDGFHVQAFHPEVGTARLSGEPARVLLEIKGYIVWDGSAGVWQVTDAYRNFVQYGTPPPQPTCPDAVTAGGAPAPSGGCLRVDIEKGQPRQGRGGPVRDKYDYTVWPLRVNLANTCEVPIDVVGSCDFAVGHGPGDTTQSRFARTIEKKDSYAPINSGTMASPHVGDGTVECRGQVSVGGQTYSWSESG
jgi:hypothetical protein